MITGGLSDGASTTAEMFDVSTGRKCSLTDLPEARFGHTQVCIFSMKMCSNEFA